MRTDFDPVMGDANSLQYEDLDLQGLSLEDLHPHEQDISEEPEQRKPSVLREPCKKQITILFIGETGSGKTSFMSLLVNLFRGNGALELEDVHVSGAESGLSMNQSQTTKPTLYTITTREGTEIRLLDTPGLADTRGIDQDEKHKAEINRAIQEHITTIDAVLILANGSVQRLAAATSYTLNVLTAMFPHSILDNIGFVFTNADHLTLNFEQDSLPKELQQSQRWLIQNPLAMVKNYRKATDANQLNEVLLKKMRKQLVSCYEDSIETLSEWIDWVDKRKTQPTHEINRLYQISMEIEALLEAALTSLTNFTNESNECKILEQKLQNSREAKEALDDFVKQQTSSLWDRQPSDNPNTLCIAPNCWSNCHTPCRLDFTNSSSELGRHCQAFGGMWTLLIDDGSTLECEICGHTAAEHRHYKHINVQKDREMDSATKQKLEGAKNEQERLQTARAATQRRIVELDRDIERAQDHIRTLVDRFNGISLSRNFAGHMNSAIQMLRLRRKGLEGRPNTDAELRLIDQSITKFQQKLDVLNKASLKSRVVDLASGAWNTAARYMPSFRGLPRR